MFSSNFPNFSDNLEYKLTDSMQHKICGLALTYLYTNSLYCTFV